MSAANDMRQAIGLLTKAMNQMSVAQASPKRRRRRARKAAQAPSQATATARPRRRRQRKRAGVANFNSDLSAGVIRLQRRELALEVSTDAQGRISTSLEIIPSSFSFLATLSKSFERSKWHSVSFCWKPLVGGLVGGLVTLGVDWDFKGDTPEVTKASAFTPNSTWAIREDCENNPLVLPASRLQSRAWYMHNATNSDKIDMGPAKLWVLGSAQSDQKSVKIGQVWVSYDLTMSGTTPA